MPIFNHATDERLAQAAAHLQQAISLIEEVAPGIVEGLAPGVVAALPQSLVAPDRPVAHIREQFNSAFDHRRSHLQRPVGQPHLPSRQHGVVQASGAAGPPPQSVPFLREPGNGDMGSTATSDEAVQSAVKVLRRKLNAAGMEDLADAIDGSTLTIMPSCSTNCRAASKLPGFAYGLPWVVQNSERAEVSINQGINRHRPLLSRTAHTTPPSNATWILPSKHLTATTHPQARPCGPIRPHVHRAPAVFHREPSRRDPRVRGQARLRDRPHLCR